MQEKKKIGKSVKGKHVSEVTRRKISKSLKGKLKSEETRMKKSKRHT
jgi:hypothetical protein